MAKIMLVEDDNNLREIYGARLLAEGHEIVAAKDGEEALALAVKEKPELIISDVMMPRISGFDMLDILRNAPETKNTKVIMMTALSQAEDKARADKLGADRYLVKSQVTLEDVAKAVNDVLAGTPSEPIEGVSGAQTTDPAPAQTVPASSTPPAITPAPQPQVATPAADPIATPPVVTPEPTPVATEAPALESPAVIAPPVAVEPTSTLPTMGVPPAPAAGIPQVQPTQLDPVAIGQPPTTNPVALDPPISTLAPDPSTAIPPPPPIEPPKTDVVAPPSTATVPDPSTTTLPESTEPESAATTDTPIKVELPTPPKELFTPDLATPTTAIPTATESAIPSVGPNLAEALQQEATDSEKAEQAGTGSLTPAAPSIVNGAEDVGIIKPTIPKPEEQPDEPPSRAEPHPPDNPLDDTPKKKVIEPINDLTKKPDLAALAAAEEGVGTVLNPGGEAVVAPNPEETPPPTPAVDDHSKIAL